MKRPLIGINGKLVTEGDDSYFKLDRNYLRAVEGAGGIPILLPFFAKAAEAKEFLSRLDGLLLTGGPDVNPARWGEAKHPKADLMHADRETSDFHILKEVLRRDLPALCICAAHQELNVALGGTLDQHVGDRKGVRGHSGGASHVVELSGASKTREILGSARPTVNSYHHQAIRDVAKELVVTATSRDGVIEGVEAPDRRFMIGVQWHPERMLGERRQRALFEALVAEAGR